jgi:hypothetical protein
MDIANHRDWRLYVHDIALFHKQFLRLCAHRFNNRVGKELLAVQPFDAFVQVYAGYTGLSVGSQISHAIAGPRTW